MSDTKEQDMKFKPKYEDSEYDVFATWFDIDVIKVNDVDKIKFTPKGEIEETYIKEITDALSMLDFKWEYDEESGSFLYVPTSDNYEEQVDFFLDVFMNFRDYFDEITANATNQTV